MEALDLWDIIENNLKQNVANNHEIDHRILSNYSNLTLDLIRKIQETSNDKIVQIFLSTLLIAKYEEEAPKGIKYYDLLNHGSHLLQIELNYKDLIIETCDLILVKELDETKDESEALNLCYYANEIAKKSKKQLTSITKGPTNFLTHIWKRITEINTSSNVPSIIKTLKSIIYAQETLKFSNLDHMIMLIHSSCFTYIENKNNLYGLGDENPQRDIQEAHKILYLLSDLKAKDNIFADELIEIKNLCLEIEAPIQELSLSIKNDINFIEPHTNFLNTSQIQDEPIYEINPSTVKKIEPYFYFTTTEFFNVYVYKGILNDNIEIAIKVYEAIHPQADWDLICKEIRIYQKLSSFASDQNCFVIYHGTYKENNSTNLIMEYLPYSLMYNISYLKTQNYIIEEQLLSMIFYKILVSFSIMKEIGIFHNDVEPENFLVDHYWNVKIIDFSASLVRNKDFDSLCEKVYFIKGTKGYLSPEIEEARAKKRETAKYNPEKSDVFSLGLVLLQILTYQDVKGFNKEKKYNELLALIDTINIPWAKVLVKKMLYIKAVKRFKFNKLLKLVPASDTLREKEL
ncbi:hypothetical protein SteCoe_26264 [Stentor coeruleus]|uniref:Protein kinase domain-containing protein n=1 Tax=Stentor coeruleus TaxID=5963 RepID=A0A1R2BDD1_9CILI|nr:hypothetical protein SteCoe_26264 [Stentor coeruleus]